jgi:hypothetical protein
MIFRSLAAERLRHPVSRRKHAKTENAAHIWAGSHSINAKLPDELTPLHQARLLEL